MPQLLGAFCGTRVPPRLITYSGKAEDRPGYTGAGDSNGNGPTAKPRDPRRRSQYDSVPSGKGCGGGVVGGLGLRKRQCVRLRNNEEEKEKTSFEDAQDRAKERLVGFAWGWDGSCSRCAAWTVGLA